MVVADVIKDVVAEVAKDPLDLMEPRAEYIVLDVADISKDAFINAIINNVKNGAINVKTHAIDDVVENNEIRSPRPSAPPE